MFTRIRLMQQVRNADENIARSHNAGLLYPTCIHQAIAWAAAFDRTQPFANCTAHVELVFPKPYGRTTVVNLDDVGDIVHVLKQLGIFEKFMEDRIVAAPPKAHNGLHAVHNNDHDHDRDNDFVVG
jgi:hypothetical protein